MTPNIFCTPHQSAQLAELGYKPEITMAAFDKAAIDAGTLMEEIYRQGFDIPEIQLQGKNYKVILGAEDYLFENPAQCLAAFLIRVLQAKKASEVIIDGEAKYQ